MEQHCSCGTRLVEDALFCHKCGKPTREIVPEEDPEQEESGAESVETEAEPATASPIQAEPAAPVAAAPAGPEIHLRNSLTLRVAMLAAGFHFLLGILLSAGGPFLAQMAPLLAGGFACYLFQRRGGFRLTVIEGARLGWLTGIMCFLLTVILFTIVMTAATSESFMTAVRESGGAGMQGDALKALERLQSEPSQVFLLIPYQFLMLTLLGSIGGALGSKLLSRD
ncbi:MAG: hypothetical protein M9913_08015 [Bryobacteraceae bacterium]|nr:hypothetical protein [Solibacteraceae bacterium]MCL4842418.1 hypothetical protein [Bryobacteraceae bacterium]MCO5350829.1 hypothetical protein [Bryobacteraceae bacterium]